jgi:hypothetical protein
MASAKYMIPAHPMEGQRAMPAKDLDKIKRELQDDLDRAQTAEIALTAERDEQSFPALVLKEKRAIDRLATVNSELSALTAKTASLRAAIAETDRRISERDKATAAEAQRKRAELAWPVAEQLVERGSRRISPNASLSRPIWRCLPNWARRRPAKRLSASIYATPMTPSSRRWTGILVR